MHRLVSRIKNLSRIFLEKVRDLLFPKFCANCKKEGDWLCENCVPAAEVWQESMAEAGLDGITAFYTYGDNTISKLIQMFKYNYLSEIAGIFEKIIYKTSFNDAWQDFVIIPAPLHARRERERGFNQAEVLAKLFAKKFGLNVNNNLRRIIYTVQQAKLSREERFLNLKDAFIFEGKVVPEKVLLVDDVYTTGATIQECARVLKDSGVKVVWGLVLAKG